MPQLLIIYGVMVLHFLYYIILFTESDSTWYNWQCNSICESDSTWYDWQCNSICESDSTWYDWQCNSIGDTKSRCQEDSKGANNLAIKIC